METPSEGKYTCLCHTPYTPNPPRITLRKLCPVQTHQHNANTSFSPKSSPVTTSCTPSAAQQSRQVALPTFTPTMNSPYPDPASPSTPAPHTPPPAPAEPHVDPSQPFRAISPQSPGPICSLTLSEIYFFSGHTPDALHDFPPAPSTNLQPFTPPPTVRPDHSPPVATTHLEHSTPPSTICQDYQDTFPAAIFSNVTPIRVAIEPSSAPLGAPPMHGYTLPENIEAGHTSSPPAAPVPAAQPPPTSAVPLAPRPVRQPRSQYPVPHSSASTSTPSNALPDPSYNSSCPATPLRPAPSGPPGSPDAALWSADAALIEALTAFIGPLSEYVYNAVYKASLGRAEDAAERKKLQLRNQLKQSPVGSKLDSATTLSRRREARVSDFKKKEYSLALEEENGRNIRHKLLLRAAFVKCVSKPVEASVQVPAFQRNAANDNIVPVDDTRKRQGSR